jgi:copper homeostasis protein
VTPQPVLLEVCVETVTSAVAAERGGAHRVELCSNLAVEGVTPSLELIEQVRRRISIPLHVLIRPRAGGFLYTPPEFELMKSEIAHARQMGVNGVVFGILDAASQVDVSRTRELVERARPLAVTFHRAFDKSANLPSALEAVIQTGATRILTSGGARNADEGSDMLSQLVRRAAGRVSILACGTIRDSNVRKIVDATGVREVHASLLRRSVQGEALEQQILQPETVACFLAAARS